MSSVKTSRDALQFEKDIRYWVTASSKSQNRNQKAALFITQLKHIISGSKSGDRLDFSSFQNAEFMQGMYEIFGDALKNPRTAELDWEEIETFIEVNPTSKKRRAQEEDNLSDGDSQHKKPKVSTRNEHEKHSLRASTRGGGSDSTLSSKYRPGSPDDATEPLSGEKATDESSLEVSATQFMCYDPPCVSCVNNHLPCIAPTDPNCLACRMCRLKKTKCSKLGNFVYAAW
ncbi:hypothetical protein BDN72DRAFT_77013 [Pluteus cervinus]|uniref:Uncharacterized protein n=1 Tax=Pluteus cervinus TaxID=181527 RepID=A0ACD3B943_9AGAR|nr:hypothetical protein BDN72DRAFT_77013 [Pluteus cervinus]